MRLVLVPLRKACEADVSRAVHQAAACLSDEKTVEQIRENTYMQFFKDFTGYSASHHSIRPWWFIS
jgi:hypothetical protein